MARNLNFGVLFQLNAQGFNKELSKALLTLRNFRRDFLTVAGALGASFGIGGIVSSLRETATSLNVARATLENTSRGFAQYSENLQFVDELSKKYKQDLIGLTDGFAKFHAAAEATNFSLEDQKMMFTNLTKAATFYHMSSERTQNLLIAVEQMMSKNKVTAEELRRQMGNNLPGAVAKMAQSVMRFGQTADGAAYKGIKSFADFEKAMANGQIKAEVLSHFLKDLGDEIGENINLDSLQLQMNELKNAWTDLVDSSGVQDALSSLYGAAAKVLNFIKNNLDEIKRSLISLATGVILGKLVGALKTLWTSIINGKILLGGWVGIATTVFMGLYQAIDKAYDKLNKVNKKLKEIRGISDKEIQLVEYKELKKEIEDYINDPKRKEKFGGKTREEYQQSLPAPGYAQYKGLAPLPYDAQLYYSKLESLPEINANIERIEKEIEKEKKDEKGGGGNGGGNNDSSDSGKKEKTIPDYIKDYNEGAKKLKNQLDAGAKTNEEYKKDLDKLAESTWLNITAFDNFRGILGELPEDMQEAGRSIEKTFKDYKDAQAAEEAAKKAKETSEAWDKYNKIGSDKQPRDTRFDYRKDNVEKLRDQQEEWDDTVDDLKEKKEYLEENFEKLGEEAAQKLQEVNDQLKEAQQNATNLKDAADLAEWRKEIEDLSKAFNKELYGGIVGGMRDIKSFADSMERISKAFTDEDASAWDKIEASLSGIISLFETINGLVETYNTLTKASEALEAAKNASELNALAQQATAQGTVTAAKAADIAVTEAATAAEAADTVVTSGNIAAKSGEAVANATASGAKLPFPYNLAAIAVGVASVIAALSYISKFAGGGIVKGSKHGDNNLAAVNGGEMILNGSQQARLWNMVNGKTGVLGTGSPEITFRLRGPDIIGAIKNTEGRARG